MPHLVVIDDDAAFGYLMTDICEDEGIAVQYFNDVWVALDAIYADPPLLVISDVFFEGAPHGVALAREVRANPATAPIPIVLVSVEETYLRSQRQEILALGCDVLIKPFTINQFLQVVKSILQT